MGELADKFYRDVKLAHAGGDTRWKRRQQRGRIAAEFGCSMRGFDMTLDVCAFAVADHNKHGA
jgi:hypothetical protein